MLLNTKLLEACKKNDVERLHTLLQAGADVNKRDCHGKYAVFHAIEHGALQVLEFLASHGADLHQASLVSIKSSACVEWGFVKYHEPPIVTASRVANVSCVRFLLANGCRGDGFASVVEDLHTPKDGLETVVSGRRYAIHHAVMRNQVEVVKALLEHGGGAGEVDHDGKTPMHYACVCKKQCPSYCLDQVKILKLLLLYGGDADVPDTLCVTPLALAINYDCFPSVECLLAAPLSASFQLSMVGLATLKSCPDMVVKLLRGNFKLDLCNSRFQTPIQAELSQQIGGEIPCILIFHGCDVNCWHRPPHASSLLYQVMRNCRLDCEVIVRLLLKTGYSLNQDTWLLERDPDHKHDAHSHSNNSTTGSTISATAFFNAETLVRFSDFKAFPIARGRMTALKNYLLGHLFNASSLKDLCRVAIRRSLSEANGGTSVLNSIRCLPLPSLLLSFLLLADVAIELEDGSVRVF